MIKNIIKSTLRKSKKPFQIGYRFIKNLLFAYKYRKIKNEKKIIYALTPPSYLKNIGDHAQVVAIRAWLQKHFPQLPVIEMDKDRGSYFLPALRWLVQPDDLFFLHSGGNLGDRGKWSESKRREIISTFPDNQIVSLPQTIYFSDTSIGKTEQENTRRIYATHPDLTVIGRDPRSGELASKLFPKAQTFCMPDFVLSLPPRNSEPRKERPKVLICLRLDDESILTPQERQKIGDNLPYECTYFDTTISEPIEIDMREKVLQETLDLFVDADVVVTDRYHGLIFTVLSETPCVVLRTIDHKLTSAIHWFKDMPQIVFAQNLDEVSSLVEHCLKIRDKKTPDWNAEYFDKIPEAIETPKK